MGDAAQSLFRKIVLHNRLVDEEVLDQLLEEIPEPQQALEHLVKQEVIALKTAQQLLDLFNSRLRKYRDAAAAQEPEPEGTSDDDQSSPSPDDAT